MARERDIGGLVQTLSNKIHRFSSSFHADGNLSFAQGRILHFILGTPKKEIFQKDVEEEFNIRPSSATVLISALEEKGLITRESVDYDNRLKRIVATEKAASYKRQVSRDIAKLEKKLRDDIPQEDLDIFFKVMDSLISNLG